MCRCSSSVLTIVPATSFTSPVEVIVVLFAPLLLRVTPPAFVEGVPMVSAAFNVAEEVPKRVTFPPRVSVLSVALFPFIIILLSVGTVIFPPPDMVGVPSIVSLVPVPANSIELERVRVLAVVLLEVINISPVFVAVPKPKLA